MASAAKVKVPLSFTSRAARTNDPLYSDTSEFFNGKRSAFQAHDDIDGLGD
jgi:hypothetical protein